jgi:porin
MKNRFLAFALLSGIFTCNIILAQESGDAFSFEGAYVGDNVNNLTGGIKTGSAYLGMANIRLGFDTEKAGWWQGGQFYINAANTHGATPSAEMLGDVQVASNIEAGDHTYIQELWIKQTIDNVEITAGLQDLNVEFANTEHGALFLNSSFGVMPAISGNVPAPIFPLTNLGLTVKWNINDKLLWLNALHEGSPTDFNENKYNLKWEYQKYDGLLGFTEFQYNLITNNLPGTYKLGAYSHNHISDSNIPDSLNINTLGIYAHADQKLWINGDKNLGVFAQLGYSPADESVNNFYWGFGLNYTGLFSNAGKDIAGLAVAHQHFNNSLKSETAIEVSYQYQLNENFFIQPDIQYIINPAGTGVNLDNCLAATLRFGFSF